MKALIVEDEDLSAERLQNLIKGIDPAIQILATFPSVFDTIAYLENSENAVPDLMFVDIHLEDGNGFRIIENLNLMTPVIFTTAFDSYMQQAFKVHSIDYLLKPINPLELQAALSKFKRLLATPIEQAVPVSEKAQTAEKFKERFIGTAGTKIFSFRTSEIAYFLIEERATFLRLFDGRHFAVEYSLEKLSQLLNPADFFRINRTMIISVNAIRQMQTNASGKLRIDLNPSLSQEVIVSADRSADFKIWLGK